MSRLPASALADLVLAVMLLEAIALFVYGTRTGRGMPVTQIWGMLLPGALLVAAGRVALAGGHPLVVMTLLGAALCAHAADLRRRWRAAAG